MPGGAGTKITKTTPCKVSGPRLAPLLLRCVRGTNLIIQLQNPIDLTGVRVDRDAVGGRIA